MRFARVARVACIVVGWWQLQTEALANPFASIPEQLEKTWHSVQMIPSTPVMMGLGLHQGLILDARDRHAVVRRFLHDQGLHPSLQLVARPSDVSDFGQLGLAQSSGLIVHEYGLRVGGYEVCKSSVRSVQFTKGGMRILGSTPLVDAVYPITDDAWEPLEGSVMLASEQLRARLHSMRDLSSDLTSDLTLVTASRCVYPSDQELKPAWRIVLRSGNTPYLLYVGADGLFEGDVLAFDATATVRAYDPNPSSGSLKDYSIPVNGDGYMTNEFFSTADASSSGPGRLQSATNMFNNNPSSAYFAEQSVFAHVYEHFVFSTQAGYKWKGPKPLTVKVHVTFSNGNINNAQYTPFDGEQGPFIYVADGDGTILKNLAVDGDVVSHEFGHHVVFSSITTTSGESLILHEGLADALTFLRSGDACLGESICPAGSTICQVQSKCLRSGATTMKYKDSTYQSLSSSPHRQGQIVSGFFWDLRQGGGISAGDLNQLFMTTITLLPSNADVKSLIIAILDADYATFGKKYQSVITAAAAARGMGVDTLGIDLASIDGVFGTSSGTKSASSSKKGFLGLCSIGADQGAGGSFGIVLAVLSLPLLVSLARRHKTVFVRIRKK
jgi:hypothetical protein